VEAGISAKLRRESGNLALFSCAREPDVFRDAQEYVDDLGVEACAGEAANGFGADSKEVAR